MEQLKVLQHSVLHWRERRSALTHYYRWLDPDVILLNSNGVRRDDPLKINSYIVYKKNETNTPSEGTTIAIRHGLTFRILENFLSDLLASEITTATGKLIVATLY